MTTPSSTDPADRSEDDLRERLRRTDPLTGRDPRLDPTSLEVLMSEITRAHLDPATQELGITPEPGTTRRRPRWLLPVVAGAAAAAVAAVALSGVLAGGPPTGAPGRVPELAVTLTVPDVDPVMSMCMQLSPELLAPQQVAVDGVVTAVDGSTATLDPSRWYRGERALTLRVEVPPQVDTALVGAPRLEVGRRYLLAGSNGQLALCGASGEWSPELEAVYRSAFPG